MSKIQTSSIYGSVITEQGDLGLGVTPIHECECEKKDQKDDKKKQIKK